MMSTMELLGRLPVLCGRFIGLALLFASVSVSAIPLYRDLPPYRHLEPGSHPIFGVNATYTSVTNNIFGNDREFRGEHSNTWYESVTTAGWAGAILLDNSNERFFGSLSGVSINSGGYDAALSNIDNKFVNTGAVHEAYLGWQSGKFDGSHDYSWRLGVGRQNFHIGNGLIIWNGGTNGGSRGDIWTGPRTAWRMTGVFNFYAKGNMLDVFYISPDELPNDYTQVGGVNIGLFKDQPAWLAFTAFNIFDSDNEVRDKLSVYNLRVGLNQKDKPGFSLVAEYVLQDFNKAGNQVGWYTELYYVFKDRSATQLNYRYAKFGVDYDPLWFGIDWFQGNYTGFFLLQNQNMESHRLSIISQVTNSVSVTGRIFWFGANELNRGQFSAPEQTMTSHDLAAEFNLNLDWAITDQWNILFLSAWVLPGQGMRQWTGGGSNVGYLAMNIQYNL